MVTQHLKPSLIYWPAPLQISAHCRNVCMASGLKCTDMCKLQDCDNHPSISDSEESADDDEDELDCDDIY